MPRPPSLTQQTCIPRDGRDALGPTWPAGAHSHEGQAGAAPFKKNRWAARRASILAVVRHAGQRAMFVAGTSYIARPGSRRLCSKCEATAERSVPSFAEWRRLAITSIGQNSIGTAAYPVTTGSLK
jgi:hypothetical protein